MWVSQIVLWASDIKIQAQFYSALLNAPIKVSNGDFKEISNSNNSVLIHLLPEEFRTQPQDIQVQDQVAIKPVFTVESIELSVSRVSYFQVRFGSEQEIFENWKYLDCIDPEGNVIQISERSLS